MLQTFPASGACPTRNSHPYSHQYSFFYFRHPVQVCLYNSDGISGSYVGSTEWDTLGFNTSFKWFNEVLAEWYIFSTRMTFHLWNVANVTHSRITDMKSPDENRFKCRHIFRMQSVNNNRDAVNGLTENAMENWVRLLKKLTAGGYWRTKRRIEIVSSHTNAVQQRDWWVKR